MNRKAGLRLLSGALLLVSSLTACRETPPAENYIYSCDAFTLYPDSVVEGDFTARAEGFGAIASDYEFTDSSDCRTTLRLRFCLNGRDNEMHSSLWHTAYIVPGDSTPVMTFGSTDSDSLRHSASEIAPSMRDRWTIRLDMRPILRSLARHGYFVTHVGDTIFKEHFKGVWVSGPDAPLTADWRTLRNRPDMQLLDHGDSTYLLTLNLRAFAPRRFDAGMVSVDSVPRTMPQMTSRQPIVDACYSIAAARLRRFLDGPELMSVASPAPAAHAVALSLAVVDPERAMELLRRCVADGRVTPEGGAGGAWPLSADRLMWVVAAYEVYKATGDRRWLREAEAVARRTLADDMHVLRDGQFGLLHGAPSSPAWGPRDYPSWITPCGLYESMSLRVNAGYSMALKAHAEMCSQLGLEPVGENIAALDDNINMALWAPASSSYSGFLYGSFYPQQSPTADNLGQSLAVVAGVAATEMARALIRLTPRWHYGPAAATPVVSLTDGPSSANAVQPHILAWWALASAKASNSESVVAAAAAFYRNFAFSQGRGYVNASTGRVTTAKLTATDRVLSDCATLAVGLRLFAGIRLDSTGMRFEPYIPPCFGDVHRIDRLRFRGATFDVELRGHGNAIQSMTIDGKRVKDATVPPDMTGHHIVRIFMMNNRLLSLPVNFRKPEVLPQIPAVRWTTERQARIAGSSDGRTVVVSENGVVVDELQRDDYNAGATGRFEVIAFASGAEQYRVGFFTRPHLILPRRSVLLLPAAFLGDAGTKLPVGEERESRYLEVSPARSKNIEVAVCSPREADFFLDVRYLNGGGQEDAQTRCVIRTLTVNDEHRGAIVMPCLGEGEWRTEAYSNAVEVRLRAGVNRISLSFSGPYDLNANRKAGTALIRHIRLIRKK